MTPQSEFVEAGGLRLHYRDWGGDGEPLLLLHGLASNARIWDLTAPLLSGRFRVFALDQRGHGLSDKPEGGYDFASITGDVAAFVQALGLERPALVGHSWGANVALQFAADRPDGVSALALVDGGFLEISAFEGMTWKRTVAVMSPPPLAGMKLEAFLQGARNWPGLGEFWNDDVQQIVLANFRVDADDTIHPHLSRDNHLKILRSLWEQKPSALWSRVRCPILLVPSTRDHPDPRNAVWMEHKRKGIALAEERAPSLEVVWMDDTIHDVPLQRPAELAGAIRSFLESRA
ncbi:MAG TPA: alpha/beta hydrolase [Dehalococcoidia bacterium]|nr:alpha/beta hydrolase [Dehalococcoidia bacterium]